MKAETLAEWRSRIADRTLITLPVSAIERVLDERLQLLAALCRLHGYNSHEGDVRGDAGCDAMDAADKAIAYAEAPIP